VAYDESVIGLRARTREAVRADIAAQAIVIFDERGFDETTVDDIVAAVGISARSFYRYFPVKEDVVTGDPLPYGLQIRDALNERPAGEDLWASLRACFAPIVKSCERDVPHNLRVMRVLMGAPSLRARNHEKHLVWAGLLSPVVIGRLEGQKTDSNRDAIGLQAHTFLHGALACLDVALYEWTRREGLTPLDSLLDSTFSLLNPSVGGF
jgi:AcrR family transcriptional regulator